MPTPGTTKCWQQMPLTQKTAKGHLQISLFSPWCNLEMASNAVRLCTQIESRLTAPDGWAPSGVWAPKAEANITMDLLLRANKHAKVTRYWKCKNPLAHIGTQLGQSTFHKTHASLLSLCTEAACWPVLKLVFAHPRERTSIGPYTGNTETETRNTGIEPGRSVSGGKSFDIHCKALTLKKQSTGIKETKGNNVFCHLRPWISSCSCVFAAPQCRAMPCPSCKLYQKFFSCVCSYVSFMHNVLFWNVCGFRHKVTKTSKVSSWYCTWNDNV